MTLDALVSLDDDGFGPLSTLDLRGPERRPAVDAERDDATDEPRPLVLRHALLAPPQHEPDGRYDPVRQVAVDYAGQPLVPQLKKDWTSIPGTATDGDGGPDNDKLDWEEV